MTILDDPRNQVQTFKTEGYSDRQKAGGEALG